MFSYFAMNAQSFYEDLEIETIKNLLLDLKIKLNVILLVKDINFLKFSILKKLYHQGYQKHLLFRLTVRVFKIGQLL